MNEFLQQLLNGLAWGSIYALIALGYTMVYGVLKLINFAHGDIYMLGAMSGYYTSRMLLRAGPASPAHGVLVLVAAMAVCALTGFLIERLAYRPLRNAPRLTALITAIGVSLFLEYGGQLLFGADPKFFPQILTQREVVRFQGVILSNIQLTIFLVSFGLMLALHLFVRRTRVGKAMRAVSFNQEASRLMGINVDAIISLTFVIGSALAAAAGVLVSLSNPKIEPLMGILPGLKAFVAAVLGGIGNIVGAMVGGIVMGLVETFVSGYLSSTYRDAIAFALLILILLTRPQGLLGGRETEKV